MPRTPRSQRIDASCIGVYHCTSRCVRRAFLCGEDRQTGQNFDHRREWIQDRFAFLAGCFKIDILGFGVLGNHFHCILRNRPDLVRAMSDTEVAMSWWRLSAASKATGGSMKPVPPEQLKAMLQPKRQRELRSRLASISYFMRFLKHPIAVRANREDDVTGRFWQGRFNDHPIRDVPQLLAAMVYVDLNPIRAGLASTPEDSRYTSVYQRILALKSKASKRRLRSRIDQVHLQIDDWLSPIEVAQGSSANVKRRSSEKRNLDATSRTSAPRASNLGCLPMSIQKYLEVVDWTGRQIRVGKRGKIPASIPPILIRLGFDECSKWLKCLTEYGSKSMADWRRRTNTREESSRLRLPREATSSVLA